MPMPQTAPLIVRVFLVPLLALGRTVHLLVVVLLVLLSFPLLLLGMIVGLTVLPGVMVMKRFACYRELAADRAAAKLIGSPAAMSAALVTLSKGPSTIPSMDLREVQALSGMTIVPLPKRRETRESDDKVDVSMRGLLDMLLDSFEISLHPPLAQRLDQLAGLSRRLARPFH